MLNRRQFMMGSSIALLVPTNGCVLLLFRLMLARGLVGGARAALSGSRGGGSVMRVAAIGRGTATATNLAIMRGARFSTRPIDGRVVDSSGSTLVTSTTVRTATTIKSRRGGVVSRSYRETDELQVHTDRFGNEIGRSYRESERRTSHFGPHARRRFGFDEIARGGNTIRHFNNARRAEEYLGQTTIESNNESELLAYADRDLADSLADIANYRGCPEADRIEEEIERLDKLCRSGQNAQCGRISRLNIRFIEALGECRS